MEYLSKPHFQSHLTCQLLYAKYYFQPYVSATSPLAHSATPYIPVMLTYIHSLQYRGPHHPSPLSDHIPVTPRPTARHSHTTNAPPPQTHPDHILSYPAFLTTSFHHQPDKNKNKKTHAKSLASHISPLFHLVCQSGHISKPHLKHIQPVHHTLNTLQKPTTSSHPLATAQAYIFPSPTNIATTFQTTTTSSHPSGHISNPHLKHSQPDISFAYRYCYHTPATVEITTVSSNLPSHISKSHLRHTWPEISLTLSSPFKHISVTSH